MCRWAAGHLSPLKEEPFPLALILFAEPPSYLPVQLGSPIYWAWLHDVPEGSTDRGWVAWEARWVRTPRVCCPAPPQPRSPGPGWRRATGARPHTRCPAAPPSRFRVGIKVPVSDGSTRQLVCRNLKQLGFVHAFTPSGRFCFPLPEQLLLSLSLQLPKAGGCLCWAAYKHLQKRARITEFILHLLVHQVSNAPAHRQALWFGALAHSSGRNKPVQLI